MIYRLIRFFSNYVTTSIIRRTNAQVNAVQNDSSEIFTYSLTQYHFNVSGFVESPVILLPIMKNGDPKSPIWVFSLGNLRVSSQDTENRDSKYIHIFSEISNTRIDFYPSYIEYIESFDSQKISKILCDLAAKAEISVSVSPNENASEPKFEIKTECSQIDFTFTPATYREFTKIGNTLVLESEIIKLLQTDKASLVKDAKKIDSIMFYNESNGKWARHYAILSGAYLYLYETNKQLYPTSYYYLLNANIQDNGKNAESEIYNLSILNIYGNCLIGFKNEKQKNDWLTLLKSHIHEFCYEPKISEEESPKNLSKNKNPSPSKSPSPIKNTINSIISRVKCKLPKINIALMGNEEREKWVTFAIEKIDFEFLLRPANFESKLQIQKLSIQSEDVNLTNNEVRIYKLLETQGEANGFELVVLGNFGKKQNNVANINPVFC